MKKRIVSFIALLVATAAVAIAAYSFQTNPTVIDVVCAFLSAGLFFTVSLLFKISDGLYYNGLIFIFMASPLGSVLDLYSSVTAYDKIVHFISGIVLAAFGMVVSRYIFRGLIVRENEEKFFIPLIFSSFLFSAAAAGAWEIFEFVADRVSGGGMQRGMVDTVTDMIVGFAGAIVYSVAAIIIHKRSK